MHKFYFYIFMTAVCLPDDPEGNAKLMLSILDCLPRANRVRVYFKNICKYGKCVDFVFIF